MSGVFFETPGHTWRYRYDPERMAVEHELLATFTARIIAREPYGQSGGIVYVLALRDCKGRQFIVRMLSRAYRCVGGFTTYIDRNAGPDCRVMAGKFSSLVKAIDSLTDSGEVMPHFQRHAYTEREN